MQIFSERLINDYYETVKEQYPDVSLKEFHVICRAPFAFLKKAMKQINMPKIRFQYFGSFVVYRKRLESSKHEENKDIMRPKKYEKIKAAVEYNLKIK